MLSMKNECHFHSILLLLCCQRNSATKEEKELNLISKRKERKVFKQKEKDEIGFYRTQSLCVSLPFFL